LPEVVERPVSVDPFNIDALAAAIEKVINDSDLRAQLSVKGLVGEPFDWRDTCRT
jgi:hypothetical protein